MGRSGRGREERKPLVFAILLLALGQAPPLYAEAVGSPASILKKGKWAMGLGGGVAPERSLKGNAEALVYQFGHFRGYGLTDWLSVYGKIGLAYIAVDDPSIVKVSDRNSTNDFDANVLSSVQLKGKLFEHKRTGWEWDGSIQYVDMRKRHKGKNEGRWHQYQFATSLAKPFGPLKPYVGVQYSIVDFTFRVREQGTVLRQGRYEEDSPVGFFVGTDWYVGRSEDVILNVETSYLDGAEVNVAIAYTF
ncbi:MAG: hypothetical protein HYZ96_01960 [Candidatus Omnitrophica bacterium]|nr:hypothetical protein [Candidatus Omnitrophota bacterium]